MPSVDQLLLKTAEELHQNTIVHIKECSEEISAMIGKLNILDSFISKVIYDVDAKVILEEVSYDLLSSIYISSKGMYRTGYISIRSAIELGISFFYFLDHNYDFLKWRKNEFDISWSKLQNLDNGVITQDYLCLFDESFEYEKFIEEIKIIYRECSEYVHGKYEYMHSVRFGKISFDIEKFKEWSKIFIKSIDIILIMLSIRFKDRLTEIGYNDLESIGEVFKDMGLKELCMTYEY